MRMSVEEAQILFENTVVDPAGGVFLGIGGNGCGRRDAVEGLAEVVADDLVSVEVFAEGLAAQDPVAFVEGRMGALG